MTDPPGTELALVPSASVQYATHLAQVDAELERASTAPATVAAYARQWALFQDWCTQTGAIMLPAEATTLRGYLAHLATEGASLSSAEQALAAIRWHHIKAGIPSHTSDRMLRQRLKGYQRIRRGERPAQMPPLLADNLQRIVSVMRDGDETYKLRLKDARDKAIILLGYAGAFRRSELARIEVGHLTSVPAGIDVYVPWSKADQEGAGRTKYINFGTNVPTCPVTALRQWLDLAGIRSGRIFRPVNRWGSVQGESLTPQVIRTVVRDRALAVGLTGFAAHSLRSGFATEAARRGASRAQIKEDGGWGRGDAVDAYLRSSQDRDKRASGFLGL